MELKTENDANDHLSEDRNDCRGEAGVIIYIIPRIFNSMKNPIESILLV